MRSTDIRTVGTRDSATALLRKLGVKKEDYNKFIQRSDDKFVVLVAAAEAAVGGHVAPDAPQATEDDPKPAAKKPAAKKPAAKKPAAKGAKKDLDKATSSRAAKPVTQLYDPYKRPTTTRTIRSVIIEGILAGRSNETIWTDVNKEFGEQPEGHKHYPAWYRGQLRRNKIISY